MKCNNFFEKANGLRKCIKQIARSLNRWTLGSAYLMALTGCLLMSLTTQAQNTPTKIWDRISGGNQNDTPSAMVATRDGGCLIGGTAYSGATGNKTQPSRGRSDYWLVKLDAAGTKQWDRRYGGDNIELLQSLHPTVDGGYLLGGESYSNNSGDKTAANPQTDGSAFWVVKIDSVGNLLWDATILGSGAQGLCAMIDTQEGSHLLAGSYVLRAEYEYNITKLTNEGVYEWNRSYGGSDDDMLKAVYRTRDAGFLLAGYSKSPVSGEKTQPSRGNDDYWLLKVDAFGRPEWDRTYGGPGIDQLSSLVPTADGGFLLGGTSTSGVGGEHSQPSRGGRDYWVVKIDSLGAKQWDRRFGGSADDKLTALLPLGSNAFLLGGTSVSGASGDKTQSSWGREDYWLVAIDAQGTLQWNQRYGADDIDELQAMALIKDGHVAISGYSTSGRNGDKSNFNFGIANYWTLKLRLATPLATSASIGDRVLMIYPNPAHQQMTVLLPSAPVPSGTIHLRDMVGRLIAQRPVTALERQQGQVLLSVGQLPAGMYQVQLVSKEQPAFTSRIAVQ
ncbi:T9SS type A sorting domain-containing protein [Hymenobacter yonginensis]|uniref:T9SS type A sorting domain-containing protein n=1 Tax=Hymenobacter yonginensis TaxID=748197 RepID=A0ABY7PL22_9BACT|nr:T9SS type A sorting domain-containing protein [Hymenobacter yonginensis]WBO82988.1 T9SS type A sorting domain-containing protein [Hymenobacter yonginensis]